MRYVAYLQRFDDAHVEIASSNERAEVVEAAIRIYSSLTSEIISRGYDAVKRQVAEERELDGIERYWRDVQANLPLHGVSSLLRAQEWNITVYDVDAVDQENLIPYPEQIFSIGATLEDPNTSNVEPAPPTGRAD